MRARAGILVVLVLAVATTAVTDDCDLLPGMDGTCPIVVNLGRGTYRLTGRDAPVVFDFWGTGRSVVMGWTEADTPQAFLCLDRDRSGRIENGSEMFGNVTTLRDGRRATNGFVALAEFDDTGNDVINEADNVWQDLLLWCDSNHNGESEPDEMTRVSESPLRAIELTYHRSGRVDQSGNLFRYESVAWVTQDGHTRAVPLYDVIFMTF